MVYDDKRRDTVCLDAHRHLAYWPYNMRVWAQLATPFWRRRVVRKDFAFIVRFALRIIILLFYQSSEEK